MGSEVEKKGAGVARCLVDELGDVGHRENIHNAHAGCVGVNESR